MMFGKYDRDSLQDASEQRTKKTLKIIKKNGGKVISMYALMGEHDLVFTLDFPYAEKAMSASLALKILTAISFSTSPVVDVEKFDRLVSKTEKL